MLSFRVAKSDGSQVFHIFVWQSSKPDILIGEQNMNREKNAAKRSQNTFFWNGRENKLKKEIIFQKFHR
jgi:hypothetical protein